MLTPDDGLKPEIYRNKTQNIYFFYFVNPTMKFYLLFIKNVSL